MIEKKTIPAISIESQKVIERLGWCEPGDFVSYQELSQIAGGDIQDGKYFALDTGRKRLERDRSYVFATVKNEGVKRLTDEEIVRTSEIGITKVRREARRSVRKLVCVDFDTLTNVAKIKHNARLSVFGALAIVTSAKKQRLIEQAVSETKTRLDVGQTLRLFGVK